MPLHKRKNGAPIHDESWTASGLAQCPGCVAASGETRRIPRVPPLSFCGTPQGGSAGRPDQTVARPFAKLNRPLRGATAVRRDLSEGMVRELGWDLNWANWAINWKHQFARRLLRKTILKQELEMVAGVRFELTTFGL